MLFNNLKGALMMLVCIVGTGCGGSEQDSFPPSQNPTQPSDPIQPEVVEVRISAQIAVDEEGLVVSRANSNSNDLIGVQLFYLNETADWRTVYACGVFDDLDHIIFKMVKGHRYLVQMLYYPDAKEYVYGYENGTFGAPFSYRYGLTSYTLNEPVYMTGDEPFVGDNPLRWLLYGFYQPTSDDMQQSFHRGTTVCYMGEAADVRIDENPNIVMNLQLCMMGITLQVGNFTEGELNLRGNPNFNDIDWTIRPGDANALQFQIPYNYLTAPGAYLYEGGESGMNIRLYYTDARGDRYLLATKYLYYKPCVNYLFRFDLAERSDGSIGIRLPGDEGLADEEASFFE